MVPGVLPRVSVLVAVPSVPVVTVAGENVPPPLVTLKTTDTPEAALLSAFVARIVTVDCEPGAPLKSLVTVRVPAACPVAPVTVTVTVRVVPPAETVRLYVPAVLGSVRGVV